MLIILFDSIIRRIKSVLWTIVLCAISIVLIYFAVYIYKDNVYCKENADKLLSGGINNTGLLSCINGLENDSLDTFRNELYGLEEIEGIGATQMPGPGYFGLEDIYKIQSKYMADLYDNGSKDWMYCTNIENTFINALNIELESGEFVSDINQPDNVTYIYLGYNLRDIPVGTEYNISTRNGEISIKLIVKGVLKKDSRMINGDMFSNTDGFYSETCFTQLDNVVVAVLNHSSSDLWLFQYNENTDFETSKKKIEEVAEKYGIDVMVGNLSNIVEEKENTTKELNRTIIDLLVIAMIVSISIMICMQIMLIINNLSEYGILCANGFSIKDICIMLVLENIIKIAIAFIVGTFASWKLILFSFAGIEEMMPVFNDIFFEYSILHVGLCSLGIILISSVIPVIMMSRYKVVDLIGGNNT